MKKLIILIITFILIISYSTSQVKYDIYTNYSLISKSHQIAKSQIGITEEKNKNVVKQYLKSVHLSLNNPWCNAFQFWSFKSACDSLKMSYDSIPMYRNGLANSNYSYALKHGTKTSFVPKVNDFVIWKYLLSNKGHIGRIDSVGKSGWIYTIEGNTSSTSIRTGGCVERKKRNVLHPLGKMNVRALIGHPSFSNSLKYKNPISPLLLLNFYLVTNINILNNYKSKPN